MTEDRRAVVISEVARLVADHLPKEFVYEAVEDAITAQIVAWKPDSYMLGNILKEIVTERTKQLLRTTYADKIEALATEAALSVVNRR